MRAAAGIALGGGRLDDGDRGARLDRVALLDGERLDHARLVGGDLVLHLHRLDDADELALLDGLALLDEHLPHVALQRRDELVGATAPAAALALGPTRLGRRRARAVDTRVHRDTADGRRPDDLDVEAPPGDLDGVGLLD